MTIREWIAKIAPLNPEQTANCWFLLQSITNHRRSELILSLDQVIEPSQLLELELGKQKMLEDHFPPQYFVGHTYFYGRKFSVDKRVLIPRFDTEVVVEAAIQELYQFPTPHILDLGTGSGAIAITLALEVPTATLIASDISADALAVAKQNATNLSANVEFIESDLFVKIEGRFDVIISNPPYLDINEEVMEMVKSYEPHLALFSPDQGLYHDRKIIEEAHKHLTSEGILILELHSKHRLPVEETALVHFNDVEIKQDLGGLDRVLIARRPR